MATWRVDPDHTVAEFIVRHMMVSLVHGQFNRCAGSVVFDPANMANSSVEAEIDATGLYTGIERRDNHLRSPDFFEVQEYPKITFKSTRVEVAAINQLKVTGDLFIHGVTRQATLNVEIAGPSNFFDDEENKMYTAYGFRATAEVNREDFGMTWNLGIEQGGFMVGKHVQIVVNAECDLVEG
jgi:polyisoprenoid-binding protein YceI